MALLPSLAGGLHFTMTDEDVISVTFGFDGDDGLSKITIDKVLNTTQDGCAKSENC